MNILIRNAVPEDRELIRPLQKEIADLHRDGRPDLFRTEARYFSDEDFSRRLADPDHVVFIAQTDTGEVVGYAFAWVIKYREHSTYLDFDSFYIDDICVLNAYRRKGIGRRLFEMCRREAKRRKCHNIDLGVWSFNKEAISFYKGCGMSERVVRMEYRLDDQI